MTVHAYMHTLMHTTHHEVAQMRGAVGDGEGDAQADEIRRGIDGERNGHEKLWRGVTNGSSVSRQGCMCVADKR